MCELLGYPERFNLKTSPTKSKGELGGYFFELNYGREVTRLGDGDIKDQDWLSSLKKDYSEYVREKYELNRSKIIADVKALVLEKSVLKEIGVGIASTAHLSVGTRPNDEELDAFASKLKNAANEIEGNE